MLALFSATFTQVLLSPSSVLLDCAMFLLRAVLATLGFYSLSMATLFNRYSIRGAKFSPEWFSTFPNFL